MIIAGIVLKRIVRAKRIIALGLLPALGLLVGILSLRGATDVRAAYAGFTRGLLIPIIIALGAFVIGSSAVTDEREDLTILYLAQTPVSRLRIVVETWLAAFAATLMLVAVPTVLAVMLAGRAEVSMAGKADLVLAVVLSTAAYTALAVALGFFTRRAMLFGLAYVLLWESIVASFASSAGNFSVSSHARVVLARSLDVLTRYEVKPPDTGVVTSLVVLVAIVAVALALAGRRLQRMNLP